GRIECERCDEAIGALPVPAEQVAQGHAAGKWPPRIESPAARPEKIGADAGEREQGEHEQAGHDGDAPAAHEPASAGLGGAEVDCSLRFQASSASASWCW